MGGISVHQALFWLIVLTGLAALWVVIAVFQNLRRVKKIKKLAESRNRAERRNHSRLQI